MNHPVAEIFSQGEEILNGHISDTNATWLSQELVKMGFVISRHTAVGDKLKDLSDLLIEISNRSDFCICTGGLGPTVDDLTAEAVANAFVCPLELDRIALKQIEQSFLSRQRKMAESNRKQALLPRGAVRIDNAWGTAPGFAIQKNRCWFVFVPGVPVEMQNMFTDTIKSELEKRYVLKADQLITIKTIGIGESDLQEKLNKFPLMNNVQLSFRAAPDEVQTKLLFPSDTEETEIKNCVNQLVKTIGEEVFVVEQANQLSTDLVSVINQLMLEKQYTLAILETATQGLISAKCVGVSWLQHSSYYQSIEILQKQWRMKQQDDFMKTAENIAQKLKSIHNNDLVLVQLYEGSHDQFQEKEKSITLYNMLITPQGILQNKLTIAGPIKRKQNYAAIRALDFLRRYLQNSAINTIK